MSAPGTFARTCADLRRLSEVVLDRTLAVGDGRALRVGVVVDPFWRDLDATIEQRCRAALAPFEVREISVDGAAIAGTAATVLLMSEMGSGLPSAVVEGLHPFTRALAAQPHLLPASAVGRANRVRALVRRATAAAFTEVDLLAWPTSATPVPTLD